MTRFGACTTWQVPLHGDSADFKRLFFHQIKMNPQSLVNATFFILERSKTETGSALFIFSEAQKVNPQALEHFCVRPDAVVGGDQPKKLTVADLTGDEVPIPIDAWFAKSRFSLDFGPSEGPDFGLVKMSPSVR